MNARHFQLGLAEDAPCQPQLGGGASNLGNRKLAVAASHLPVRLLDWYPSAHQIFPVALQAHHAEQWACAWSEPRERWTRALRLSSARPGRANLVQCLLAELLLKLSRLLLVLAPCCLHTRTRGDGVGSQEHQCVLRTNPAT